MKAFKWWIVEELFRQLEEDPEKSEAVFDVDKEVSLRLSNLGIGYGLSIVLYPNGEKDASTWQVLPIAQGTEQSKLRTALENRLLISDIIENKLSYKYPEF